MPKHLHDENILTNANELKNHAEKLLPTAMQLVAAATTSSLAQSASMQFAMNISKARLWLPLVAVA